MASRDSIRRILVRNHRLRKLLPVSFGRVLDLTIVVPALVALSPLMAIVALAVAAERRGSILFRHVRIGRGGREFIVYKFRSMHRDGDRILAEHLACDAEAADEWRRDHKLRRDPRVTKLGDLLRKTSLDELPQLFNVLLGQMSIVGPRPIVIAEVPRYGRYFTCYCAVNPGITGIWQVSGRNDVSYQRRVLMDALYSRRKCVLLDLKIIVATVPAVLARKGSY